MSGKVIQGRSCQYQIDASIGGGTSASVFKGIDLTTGEEVAVKAIDRLTLQASERKQQLLRRELHIAGRLKHPNIINLIEVVFDDNHVMLIMELAKGGELYDAVKGGPMPDVRARWVFQQIISAMEYCHGMGVCHRDLKLENLMVDNVDGTERIKVTDFGLSKDQNQHSNPHTKVGTISYMAPEVTEANNSEPYDGPAADIWSLGCILYVLVCCKYPFGYDGPPSVGGEPTRVVYSRIRAGNYSPFPAFVSPSCQDLIRQMLAVRPSERATVQTINMHPWMQEGPAYHPAAMVCENDSAAETLDMWTSAADSAADGDATPMGDAMGDTLNDDMNDDDQFDSGMVGSSMPSEPPMNDDPMGMGYSSFDSAFVEPDAQNMSDPAFGLAAGTSSLESLERVDSLSESFST